MFTKSKPLANFKIFFFLIVTLFATACEEQNNVPFDKQRWRQANHRERGQMIPDLHNSKVLLGKSVRQTLDLLGPADDSSEYFLSYTFDNGKKYMGSNWVYYMNLRFDSTSKVCTSIGWDD
jgi:hypothetical protein